MLVGGFTAPIHVPTLFVKPQKGLNRSAWQLQPYRDYCRTLQIVEVLGNHWAFLVEPQTFNKQIEDFLSSVLE
jgi:pimeloyl-ACP methyl ester carboxylesterase